MLRELQTDGLEASVKTNWLKSFSDGMCVFWLWAVGCVMCDVDVFVYYPCGMYVVYTTITTC